MATYFVMAHDNQRYGPVDDDGLVAWAREGRVAADTMVFCQETNATLPARSVAVLLPVFAPVSVSAPTPQALSMQPINYLPGYGPVFPNGHELSDFPVVGIVLLQIFVGIFGTIWFNLMHGKINMNRPDDPGAGKAIGFCFIPFFNIWYWSFFTYRRLVLRVNEQRVNYGLPPANLDAMALTYCIFCACIFPLFCVPLIGILVMLGVTISGCIFFAQLQQAVNELVMVTRQRAMASVVPGAQPVR